MIDLSLVIPCFNEESRLGPTLDDALAWSRASGRAVEIVVVDDGSSDGTSALVERRAASEPSLRLLRLGLPNHGKGFAVRAGLLAAQGALRAFADADGAVPFAEIERLEAAVRAGADIAVGSRVLDPSRVDAVFYRRAVGFFFRTLVHFLAVRTVRDTQCGFKLFKAAAVEAVFAEQVLQGFAFDVEALARAERLGLRIAEVPVQWHERSGSKVRVVRDGLRMLRDILRLRRHLRRN